MLKWTERRPHISQGFIKTDVEAKVGVDNKIFSYTTDHLVGIEREIEGIIIITIEIIDPTIEIDPETVIDVITEEITTSPIKDIIITDKTIGEGIATERTVEIDKIIEEMTPDKDTETGMKVGTDQEIIAMIGLEAETEIDIEMDGCNLDPEHCQMTEEDQGLDLTLE